MGALAWRQGAATWLATFVAAALTLLHPAAAADRVALVIGNSAYSSVPSLKNPRNDAEAVSRALERLGFKVIEGTDVDQIGLKKVVREFTREVDSATVALFFYAGHGLQVNGRNYLVPVDASLQREADIDFETMDLDFVLKQLERKDRTNIVFLDACRNNPLSTKLAAGMGQRSVFVGRGLARVDTGVGTFIGYATQPDAVALDGAGSNSPFTEALLKYIETPGLDIELLMRRVREDVIEATSGAQVPWSNSSLVGDRVVLKAAVKVEETKQQTETQTQTGFTPSGASERDVEILLWNAVKDSNNISFLRSYLATYPNGSFAALARAIIDDLEGRKRANVAPEAPKAPVTEAVEQKPQPEAEALKEAPAEALKEAPAEEPKVAPKVKKTPVAVIEPREQPEPRVKKAPAVQKKKKIAKPRIVEEPPPVRKKRRVQQSPRFEVEVSGPVSNCGLCYPDGMKSFGRRRLCGVRYQSALAAGECS
ncbi:MAG: caspase family protein [Parvibaculaceae bacterium]